MPLVSLFKCPLYTLLVENSLFFQSTTKAKLPISLHLNLCNVKVIQHTHTHTHTHYNHKLVIIIIMTYPLPLNIFPIQLALPTDTERNFAFKITSPSRVLLLQAEDSRDLQDWMEVLNNAITFAIQGQATSPDREMAPGMLASGDKSTLKSSLNSSGVSSPAGSDGAPV